jgi:hypothetical protein
MTTRRAVERFVRALAAMAVTACAGGALESQGSGPAGPGAQPGGSNVEPGRGGTETPPTNDSPANGGDQSAPPSLPPNAPSVAPFEPSEAVLPRLTASQYRRTLGAIFGEGLPRTPVEPDTNPYLFYSIGAATTEISERGVEQYAEAASLLSASVFQDAARLGRVLTCAPTTPDDACADAFVRGLGRRLFRRPLDEDEVQDWLALSRDTAENDPMRGLETVLAGLLQSPSFVYRVELGEVAPEGDGTRLRYSAFEMASRVAFLLTNTGPDDALLDAAARGELVDDASLEAHTRRLLDTPAAREAVQDFFAQFLDLSRLARVELDPALYPAFNPGLLRAMETEVRLLVDDLVFRRQGDARGLFSARRGYVNRALAELYGVEAPGATDTAFVPVDFGPETPRAGVLTLGAFLTMNAHRTETSPTLRGKYIRERVLCQDVPPPPDDIDLNLERQEGEPPTLRERLEQHRTNPICAGCHAFIDPPGFLFEHYDSMGRYRTEAEGFPINAAGDLDGAPLESALDLADRLREDPRVGACMTRQLYRYANGRLDAPTDRAVLKDLEARFVASGHDFRTLLVSLVASEGFRQVAPAAAEVMP